MNRHARRLATALSALLLLVAVAACRPAGTSDDAAGEGRAPSGPPAIAGVVTAAGPGRTLRVEERPEDESGSAKAQVEVPEGASVTSGGRRVALEAIRVGSRVRVWFTGPVRESYPVQATASAVMIDSLAK